MILEKTLEVLFPQGAVKRRIAVLILETVRREKRLPVTSDVIKPLLGNNGFKYSTYQDVRKKLLKYKLIVKEGSGWGYFVLGDNIFFKEWLDFIQGKE